MSKVFIPSIPTRYDAATRQRVPSLDLNPATQYGELVNIVDGPVNDTQQAIDIIRARSPDITCDDYILAVGDVLLIAALIAYTCERNESVHVLRWDKFRHDYDVVDVTL